MYKKIQENHRSGKTSLAVLVDPDKAENIESICKHIADGGADFIFVGSSLLLENHFDDLCLQIKEAVPEIPLIIFPGSTMQLSEHADALLFLSVISSRNAELIIGKQVQAAPMVKKMGIEAISTAYMLIESGNLTSAQYMSNSLPIPRAKTDIAIAHAMAAEIMGMQLIYLEAGSGAKECVPVEMIEAIRKRTDIPIIAGGGIKTPDQARKKAQAGASIVVIGTHFEENNTSERVREFAQAVHGNSKNI